MKEGWLIKVITYQSEAVLRILKSGQVYRAHKSLSFGKQYGALVDILQLNCESPIFGCLKYHRRCTNGKVSSSVKFLLEVPAEKVKLTEYSVWADFLYAQKFTLAEDYSHVAGLCQELDQETLDKMIHSLQKQKRPWQYRIPQAVLEEIRPEWVIKYQLRSHSPFQNLFV